MSLKNDDKMISVTDSDYSDVFVATRDGYGLWYDISEVSPVGIRASGVKSIKLKDDIVVSSLLFDPSCEFISIIMDRGTAKRLKLSEVTKTTRANRGILLMKEIKSNPSKIVSIYIEKVKNEINITSIKENKTIKLSEISIMDRASNGSFIVKDRILYTYPVVKLISRDILDEPLETISDEKKTYDNKELDYVKKIDNKILTIDNLLDNIEN